jgi:hypothetical protein
LAKGSASDERMATRMNGKDEVRRMKDEKLID